MRIKKKIILWLILDLLLAVVVMFEGWILARRYLENRDTGRAVVSEETAPAPTPAGAEEVLTPAAAAETAETTTVPEVTEAVKTTTMPEVTDTAEAVKPAEVLDAQEFVRQAEELIQSTGGVWEVYIADVGEEEILMNKGAGKNLSAGAAEYFFMAEQIYQDMEKGNLADTQAQSVDSLLRNGDSISHEQVRSLFFESSVIREEDGTLRLNPSVGDYPYTLWRAEETYEGVAEDRTAYTCARDGAVLMKNIEWNASDGSSYAQNEKDVLENVREEGCISAALEADGAQVLELFDREDTSRRIEDFAYITANNGERYLMGIMAEDYPDAEAAEETLKEIAALTADYYASSGNAGW